MTIGVVVNTRDYNIQETLRTMERDTSVTYGRATIRNTFTTRFRVLLVAWSQNQPHPLPKCPPFALHEAANALGVTVVVRVHFSDSVLVIIVGDHTAVDTVSVGVGAVMVSYSMPAFTVMGGKVE